MGAAPARRDADTGVVIVSAQGRMVTIGGASTLTGAAAELDTLAAKLADLCAAFGVSTLAMDVSRLPPAYKAVAAALRERECRTHVKPFSLLGPRPLSVPQTVRMEDSPAEVGAMLESGRLAPSSPSAPWVPALEEALGAWSPDTTDTPGRPLVAALALAVRLAARGAVTIHSPRGISLSEARRRLSGDDGVHPSQHQPDAGMGGGHAGMARQMRGAAARGRPHPAGRIRRRWTSPEIDVNAAVREYKDQNGMS